MEEHFKQYSGGGGSGDPNLWFYSYKYDHGREQTDNNGTHYYPIQLKVTRGEAKQTYKAWLSIDDKDRHLWIFNRGKLRRVNFSRW